MSSLMCSSSQTSIPVPNKTLVLLLAIVTLFGTILPRMVWNFGTRLSPREDNHFLLVDPDS